MMASPLVIELTRRVDVRGLHVLGEIGFAQKRDEIAALTLLALEHHGVASPADVSERLLGGKPEAMARRLLRVAESLGLFDARKEPDDTWVLTPAGKNVADNREVFVPERGTWSLFFAYDELVPGSDRLLRVEPYEEPSAFDEKRSDTERETRVIETWEQEATRVARPLGWVDKAVSVGRLEPRVEPFPAEGAVVRVFWRFEQAKPASIRAWGRIGETTSEVAISSTSDLSFDDVMRLVLGDAAPSWNGISLAVSFESTSAEEKRAMVRVVERNGLTVPSFGQFDPLTVRNVPLRPASDADAQRWAEWLMTDKTRDYLPAERFAKQWKEVLTAFETHHLKVPDQATLARAVLLDPSGRRPSAYWHLQAPLDWAL